MTNKNIILVRTNEARITEEERSIIGTNSLATCTGILLYNKDTRLAIVAHLISSNPIPGLDKMFNILIKNKLLHTNFEYAVFTDYDSSAAKYYNTLDIINEHLNYQTFTPMPKEKLINATINDDVVGSKTFLFDAITGTFVTDKYYDEVNINFKNIKYR